MRSIRPAPIMLCDSLFTYAGHHNNSFAKSILNQTKLDPGPKFDTLGVHMNAETLI